MSRSDEHKWAIIGTLVICLFLLVHGFISFTLIADMVQDRVLLLFGKLCLKAQKTIRKA